MESALKEMPRSIAIKGYNSDSISAKKSKGNQNTFADFMRDLGKTTAPKNAKSTALNPSDKATKTSTTSDLSANNEAQKTEILSNLLKSKSQEVKSEKTPQSPLDSILQRPKATRTKLNATPEIKQPEAPSEGRFSNRDAVMRSLKGTNISFADSTDDKGFMKIVENSTESAKNRAIPSVSDLQNEGQKMAQNNAKADFADLTPKDLSPKTPQSVANKNDTTPKIAPKMEAKSEQENMAQKNFAQNSAIPSDNSTKAENPTPKENNSKTPNATNQHTNFDETNQSANLVESSVESALDATQGDEILRNMTSEKAINANITQNAQMPSVAQESQIKVSDSKQTPQNPQISQTPQEAQNTQNAKDSTPQNFAKLGIANTLKYGAFKAFDALSLLKPSDGKKLSELIKKADELSLNLQSVKYTKMAQTPLSQNYFANQLAESKHNIEPKLESKAQNSANQIAPKEVPSQVAQDSALAKVLNESPKEMPKAPSEAIPSNEAQMPKNDKSADVNSPKDSKIAQNDKNAQQNAESKAVESKIVESKIPDSKMVESKAQEPKIEQSKVPEPKINEAKVPEPKIPENSTESKVMESKIADSKAEQQKTHEQTPKSATNAQNSDIKPISLKENAIPNKGDSSANQSAFQSESPQNITHTEQNQKTEQLGSKLFDARETMRHFAHNLRNEIQNYKPPLTKITLELQPANLGSVEVSIISQGKNIQIQLNAPQNTLNLFIQNQSDLRTALSQIGYDNVAMSFSNGSQMGFSDNSGKWRYESNANKFRNNFGLKSVDEAQDENEVFEIMITNNYA